MSSKRYTEEFKLEALKQVTQRGHPVSDVATRLGVSQHSLYAWLKTYSLAPQARQEQQSQAVEIRRLKAELKRVSEERDILKKAAAYFAKESR
jgi:transposase